MPKHAYITEPSELHSLCDCFYAIQLNTECKWTWSVCQQCYKSHI